MQPEGASVPAEGSAFDCALLCTVSYCGCEGANVIVGDVANVFIQDFDMQCGRVGHVPDLPCFVPHRRQCVWFHGRSAPR